MDEHHHYDLAIRKENGLYKVIERLNIGDIKSVQNEYVLGDVNQAKLMINSTSERYYFYLETDHSQVEPGSAHTKYLSSEVAVGFTGVFIGLYACGEGSFAQFKDFKV